MKTSALSKLPWAVVAIVVVVAYLIWPGDAPWINDEPTLIARALEANARGTWVTSGLLGTRGFVYGPLPTWFYQLGLALTRSLPALVVLKSVLFLVTLAAALFLVCRRLFIGVWPLVLAAAVASPFFWFYSRLLWDNVFLLPFGAGLVLALVEYLVRPSVWRLGLVALLSVAVLHIHLMSLALVGAVAVAVALSGRKRANERILEFGIATLIFGVGFAPILSQWLTSRPGVNFRMPLTTETLLFPWLGGRLFSAWGMSYFLEQNWLQVLPSPLGSFAGVLCAATAVAVPISWLGLGLAVRHVITGWRIGEAALRFWFSSAAVAGVVLCWVLTVVSRLDFHPHYYGGVWFFWLYFLGLGLEFAALSRAGVWLGRLYVGSLIGSLALIVVLLHGSGGNQGIHYGPTLANQLEVACRVFSFLPAKRVELVAPPWRRFPHALRALKPFCPLAADSEQTIGAGVVRVEFEEPNGYSGRLLIRSE